MTQREIKQQQLAEYMRSPEATDLVIQHYARALKNETRRRAEAEDKLEASRWLRERAEA